MSGGFFRGTSADQDTRFSNKQAKLFKSQKFAPELDHLVDMTKVKMDVIRPWIATRATELLGFEDEVLINFVYGLLEGKVVDGKQIQIQLTGFMEKNTGKFMKELWSLLLSAQSNVSGVPQQFLDAKEEEQRKKKEENDRIAQEIQKRKERTSMEFEREKQSKMDSEDGERRPIRTGPDFSQPRASCGQPEEDSEEDRTNDQKIRNWDGQRSSSRSASSQSERLSISPRKRYQSHVRRSLTPERRHRSPQLYLISPRRKYSPTKSLSRERRPHARRRSISRSRHRSPQYWRRTSHFRRRSPYLRRRSSPQRWRSRSPIHHRSPPFCRSPSPLPRRSPPINRRSPQVRMRSPSHKRSPVRYRSPSPLRYESPSPIRRRSPQSRSMKRQKQSPRYSPLSWPADSISQGYKNRSLSPSGSEGPLDQRRLNREHVNHVDSDEPRQSQDERTLEKRLSSYNGLGRGLAKEDDSEEPPVHSRSRTGLRILSRVNSRSPSSSVSPVMRKRENAFHHDSSKIIREEERTAAYESDVDDRQVLRHALQSSEEIEYGPGGARRQMSPLVDVHDGRNSAKNAATVNFEEKEYTEHAMRNNDQTSINDVRPRLKVEANREREHGKRHRKRFDNHEKDIEESSDNSSEEEDRKEAKRRRKEKKKLRREEKHRRREERHRRRLEHRAAKQKAKANDTVTPLSDLESRQGVGNEFDGDAGDIASEQKRLEIELREKALESLRAKKAISD